jgi:membrane-associated phospholipid phosphatase
VTFDGVAAVAEAGGARSTREGRPLLAFWHGPPPRLWCAAAWVVQSAALCSLYLRLNGATSGHSVAMPLLPLESRIPFVPAAFPIYVSLCFEAALLPVVWPRTGRAFVRMQVACALACSFAFVTYALIPMSYPRPHLAACGVVPGWLAAYWEVDGPSCTFPSLHVTLAWLLAFALGEGSRFRRQAWWLNALLISASTLLVKQHYMVDVAGGIVLAAVAWRAATRMSARLEAGVRELGV